jgi:gas vesicle protein
MARKSNSTMAVDALKVVGGGIVGAGLALLLAPQAGRQTRRDIVRYAKTIRGKTDEAVCNFADNVDDLVEMVGDRAARILHDGKELTAEAKKDLLAAMEKGQAKLERQKNRLAHMIG